MTFIPDQEPIGGDPDRDDKPNPRKPVNIDPASFAPSDILEMPAEEVIRTLFVQEARRTHEEKDLKQRVVQVHYRVIPEALLASLESIEHATGFGGSIVTRCLGHKARAWLLALPESREVCDLHQVVHDGADGHPDIIQRMNIDQYAFLRSSMPYNRSKMGGLSSVSFLVADIQRLGKALGIPAYKLLQVGLCYAVASNTCGWCPRNVAGYLLPEVNNFRLYCGERLAALRYLKSIIEQRDQQGSGGQSGQQDG